MPYRSMATQHGHPGGEYQLEMLQCKLCGDSIHFNDMIVIERTGKQEAQERIKKIKELGYNNVSAIDLR
jgi:hypothetical protein